LGLENLNFTLKPIFESVFSIARSEVDCRFSQKRSEWRKYLDNLRAVSAPIERLPGAISLIRRAGALTSFAN
jgi:hypothetical protein